MDIHLPEWHIRRVDCERATKAESGAPLVGSVVQAIAILRHLGRVEGGRGVTAIAKDLAISPSSCFNLLKTLVTEDLVDFDPHVKTYVLGTGAMELAHRSFVRAEEQVVARARLQAVADEFGIACGLWRLTRAERLVLVMLAETSAVTRIHLSIGQRQPMLAGAAGRSVAAAQGLSADEITERLRSTRWNDAPTPAEYLEDVTRARRLGWAVDADRLLRGVTSVASAIVDERGVARFCVSGTMFSGQYQPTEIDRIGAALSGIAAEASRNSYGARVAAASPGSGKKVATKSN